MTWCPAECCAFTAIAARCQVIAANMVACPQKCRPARRSAARKPSTASQPNHAVPTANAATSAEVGTSAVSATQVGLATISSITTAIVRWAALEMRCRASCRRVSS